MLNVIMLSDKAPNKTVAEHDVLCYRGIDYNCKMFWEKDRETMFPVQYSSLFAWEIIFVGAVIVVVSDVILSRWVHRHSVT